MLHTTTGRFKHFYFNRPPIFYRFLTDQISREPLCSHVRLLSAVIVTKNLVFFSGEERSYSCPDFFLVRQMKYATPPIKRYGKIIRYMIPSLIPFAEVCEASLSSTARHIAHWAWTSILNSNRKIIITMAFFPIFD